MEQNKQVAIHAKEIAEKRLLKQDYAGAKAMALKAKKLLPPENLSQLLAVCEVHCSAQLMANGLYDWYKIIQVEPLSDEIMIKKQYHKLVALLHPDKNKIPGAEAAFKLVVEANNTLSD
ncbi:DnaJ domain-containing protein [Rhynchospora pubera]|nr:DnaJ domain-containing protein [Rhynchospora pubera]